MKAATSKGGRISTSALFAKVSRATESGNSPIGFSSLIALDRLSARDYPAAIAAFQQVCALDAEDRLGAGLHLVRLGALAAGDMPAAYVRTLFDQYAPRFDAALTEGLGYRGPAILREASTLSPYGNPMMEPSDIADVILYLASDAARALQGSFVLADQDISSAMPAPGG